MINVKQNKEENGAAVKVTRGRGGIAERRGRRKGELKEEELGEGREEEE